MTRSLLNHVPSIGLAVMFLATALGMGIVALLLLAFVPLLGVPLLALVQFFALGAAVSSRLGRTLPPHVS